jgi:hypothetical protein
MPSLSSITFPFTPHILSHPKSKQQEGSSKTTETDGLHLICLSSQHPLFSCVPVLSMQYRGWRELEEKEAKATSRKKRKMVRNPILFKEYDFVRQQEKGCSLVVCFVLSLLFLSLPLTHCIPGARSPLLLLLSTSCLSESIESSLPLFLFSALPFVFLNKGINFSIHILLP